MNLYGIKEYNNLCFNLGTAYFYNKDKEQCRTYFDKARTLYN